MKIDPKTVMALREKTGAGVMDCKKALAETAGDLEKAVTWLHDKGIAAAAQRADRVASEGSVGSYIHAGGKLGVLIEVNCETDFCAKSEAFQALVKELAMQVAAANPVCVKREDVSAAVIEQERQIYASQAEGKPAGVVTKIIEGKVDKFYRESCLLEQAYIRDPNKSVSDLLTEAGLQMREKIEVRRFMRFQLGEPNEPGVAN
ncbi:MAG: translation elongation factor Ts [Candidatus Binatus sp.]|uniref:translation elongation factor Ts n=1 Tax=Candidatus Binatus sp. TaxID=2811406 RepID=UPI0027280DEE|nr:translation elongation factor Ts [Candidatus Binatus sp.]MDO8433664.1 translation elongation factor Ts [Candidatus Binatus sp.]